MICGVNNARSKQISLN